MFKTASFTDELMSDMEKNLIKTAVDLGTQNRLSKAIDYLDYAARIFEDAGMPSYSNQIVEILSEVAGEITVPNQDEMNAFDKGK